MERHFGQIWWLHIKGENSPYNGAWRALLGLAGPSKGGLDTDHDIDGGREDENDDDGGVMLDDTLPEAEVEVTHQESL